jgi:hypothetical protein
MATIQGNTSGVEAAILSRLIRPGQDDLPKEVASALLRMDFDRNDLDRLHELATKNQDDALTPAEKLDLESYLRISSFFDLMHAKAHRSLKKKS